MERRALHRNRGNPVVSAVASALIAALLMGCGPDDSRRLLGRGAAMGTTWAVWVTGRAGEGGDDVRWSRWVADELARVEAVFSTWDEGSELSLWNATAAVGVGDWIPVREELADVVAAALDVSRLSDGALDPTVGPLVELWGFGRAGVVTAPPDAEAVAAARRTTGWERLDVRTHPPALRRTVAGLRLDLSAIAKGHAIDRVGEGLAAAGYGSWLVEVGGELRAWGLPGAEGWRVGVQVPGAPDGELLGELVLRNEAIATSGTYRQGFEAGGRRYSHVLDPATGEPVAHDTVAVSVVAPTAREADAWATALLVIGAEGGERLARDAGIRAVFVRGEKVGGGEGRLRTLSAESAAELPIP